MKIAIFGLGHVGCVSAACFAQDGYRIVGVDVDPSKVALVGQGMSPIVEPGLPELLREGVATGRIDVTADAFDAVSDSDILMICVGTPSGPDGELDLTPLKTVCGAIGEALRTIDHYAVVVIRSTILPGTAENVLIPLLEQLSGKQAGKGFGFCVNPEFLREGNALADFHQPPYTVIGALDARSGEMVSSVYANIDAPLELVAMGEATMIKYASNAFHAMKVAFANEVGTICEAHGVNGNAVMDIFVQDTKLNVSPAYLKPGFAFGGPCLPKDLRALTVAADRAGLPAPLLESVLVSNDAQIEHATNVVLATGRRRVGLVGLSFKPNTDDTRESPAWRLAERLLAHGIDLSIYDPDILVQRMPALQPVSAELPTPVSPWQRLQPTLADVLSHADLLVITKPLNSADDRLLLDHLNGHCIVLDLTRPTI